MYSPRARAQSLRREDAPLYLTGAAIVATPLSISAFEILMALAIAAFVFTRKRLRLPPIWLPLALFMCATLVSLAVSGHIREGLPQLRKFYIYSMLILVTSVFENVRQLRTVAAGWVLAAASSALWGLVQFEQSYVQAGVEHQPFYVFYVSRRITGFADHWMTLGGEMMMALLVIAAVALLARDRRRIWIFIAAAVPIVFALQATWTRSAWLGALCGLVYLIWCWRPVAVLAAPVAVGLLLAANPFGVRERAVSAFAPHGAADSNGHREELREIGWRMIKAHPWLGLGPEQISRQYKNYLRAGQEPRSGEYYGHLENDYLQYAAERGIPALAGLLWMIGRAMWDFMRALRRTNSALDGQWVLHAALAVTLAVLVSGFYSWNLNSSPLLAMFLSFTGQGYVAALSEGPV